MPILNFSENASQQCKNHLREDGLAETALSTYSGKYPLAPELGAESRVPNAAAFPLKPRRNCHSTGGLCHVLPPTFAFPLSSFTAALLSSEPHHGIHFLVKKQLSLAFSLLQLPAGDQYQAILSLPGI